MSEIAARADACSHRDALEQLAALPVEELRRLACQLEVQQRVIRTLLKERTRRSDHQLALVVGSA